MPTTVIVLNGRFVPMTGQTLSEHEQPVARSVDWRAAAMKQRQQLRC